MKAEDMDRQFDEGGDVHQALDLSKAKRPLQAQTHVGLNLPQWMIDRLDREARRLDVTRESMIKVWLAERLDQPPTEPARD